MSGGRIPAELRRRVAEASRFRCGYCLTSQHIVGPLLEIDHILPESRGGADEEGKLILACPMCNSHKADRIDALDPEGHGRVPLFNPRQDRWEEHFQWNDDRTMVEGRTAIGRATIVALSINHPDTVLARRLWVLAGWHPPAD